MPIKLGKGSKANVDLSLNRPGARISHQLFASISEAVARLFESANDVLCANAGHKFSERQTYGLLVQALSEMKDDHKPEFVLTELPVRRGRQETGTPGRVDFLFFTRNQAFAIELKLVHRGLKNNNGNGVSIKNSWYKKPQPNRKRSDLIGQLRSLDFRTEFFKSLVGASRKLVPIKFPLLIVCYDRQHRAGDSPVIQDVDIETAHNELRSILSQPKDVRPSFQAVFRLKPQPRPGKNEGRAVTVFGLGFFGGAACFQNK